MNWKVFIWRSIIKLKEKMRNLLHYFGYDVHKISVQTNTNIQFVRTLSHLNINFVFDVGANKGQFASKIRSLGYAGKILSFEPLSTAHQELSNKAAGDSKWQVYPRTAIGNNSGNVTINISKNSVSSSILQMNKLHKTAAENSIYIGYEDAPIQQLDLIGPDYLNCSIRPFLKIDTQGFELEVINGAKKIIPQLQGILCELSIAILYEGQPTWLEMIKKLESQGFTLWSIYKGFTDPSTGRTLQVDAVFVKTSLLEVENC